MIFRKIKEALAAWLRKLEKENKETFPDGRADCCKLNDNRENR